MHTEESLDKISKELFGGKARLEVVDPKTLVLLKKNARFMKKEAFEQLVSNVEKDSRLSSMPLCYLHENGKKEVLSGNHRVQAAISAKLEKILVMTVLEKLSKSEQISIQLSHNALVGEDDQSVLSALWAEIEELDQKLYAGLSSDLVEKVEKVSMTTFSTPAILSKVVNLVFVKEEAELLDNVVEELSALATSSQIYLVSMDSWDNFFATIQEVKKTHNIKNASLAMLKMLEIVKEDLQRGGGQ